MSKLLVIFLLQCLLQPAFANFNIEEDYPYIETIYKDIHKHPELSLFETRTAGILKRELTNLGFEIIDGIGAKTFRQKALKESWRYDKTVSGFAAILKNGNGPTILLRTDLDALPIEEKTKVPYASKVKTHDHLGNEVHVMHACGHDMHASVLIGVARQLVRTKKDWQGTLVLIGQPAEELAIGAQLLIDDGLFSKIPKPKYNLAYHVSADLPAGEIGYVKKWAMANVDMVDLEVYGKDGHGAYPHQTKDPIVLAASIIMDLQTLVSREISPLEPAVVSVGAIHGGTKHNIIPDKVHIKMTVRSFSEEIRMKILKGIERIAHGNAKAYGLHSNKMPKMTFEEDYTPALFNTPSLVKKVVKFRVNDFQDRLVQVDKVLAGEDFSQYGRTPAKIPTALFWLGSVNQDKYRLAKTLNHSLPSLHSAHFLPDPQPTIKTGVEFMTKTCIDLFND